ncbi:UDP-N-acetylmuramoyl-tripeptide--D-alanyl-D-alanine ligase [Rickettsia endosymbiont of Halotydeus destructor]|uniref:UDP-N-acetylmuramoyl-tripeptide--D-alanyl-D- alanine ligase n=1 Tax=Rickettsia endosymbiont of Halotydeus destructor TaxID=2996754 RepID=UPI003BAE82C9
MIWNSETLSKALGVVVPSSIEANEVQFNSNDVRPGDLFIALKGNRDGHDYVTHAIEQGAGAVIINRNIPEVPRHKTIIVDDTFVALQKMAKYKRENSKAIFIGITGSVGKTSTKEALKIILSMDNVFASRGNFNNYLGVLLNLASMPDDVKYAIFELGMNHVREIREITKILPLDIAIITNISEAHLEFFSSLEEITEAKCEIFEGLKKEGVAIVNKDTLYYNNILANLKKLSVNNVYSFGDVANVNAKLISYEHQGDTVHLSYLINNNKVGVTVSFIPEHYAKNFAAVLLVASLLGKNLEEASEQLANIPLTKGRGEIITAQIGANSHHIMCDYYNASPESMKAGLKYLKQLPSNSKIAIIGEMLELGQNSKQLHQDLIPYILDARCSKVFIVGTHAKCIYDLLPKEITKAYFENVDDLIKDLPNLLDRDELILIKGSRGIRLDKIITYFKG